MPRIYKDKTSGETETIDGSYAATRVRKTKRLLWLVCDDCGARARPGERKMLQTWVRSACEWPDNDDATYPVGSVYCGDCCK